MSDAPDLQEDTPTQSPPHKWYSLHALLPVLATLGTAFVAVAIVLPSIIAARAPDAEGEHDEDTIETVEATLPVTEASTSVAVVSTDVPTTAPETTDEPTTRPQTTNEPATIASTLAPTNIPTTAPTRKPTESPATPIPTDIPFTATPTADPNLILFYDQDAFTIYNTSDDHVSLEGVTFRGQNLTWDVATFGSMVQALPKGRCLRLRDAAVGNRTPPAECGGQFLGFLEIGAEEIFWRGDSFDVLRDEVVVATCSKGANRCEVFIEPKRG